MKTITEFLLERIADDQKWSDKILNPPNYTDAAVALRWRGWAQRIAKECEAKRRIVADHPHWTARNSNGEWEVCDRCVETSDSQALHYFGEASPLNWPCLALRALATIYDDHPDFIEDWRA